MYKYIYIFICSQGYIVNKYRIIYFSILLAFYKTINHYFLNYLCTLNLRKYNLTSDHFLLDLSILKFLTANKNSSTTSEI